MDRLVRVEHFPAATGLANEKVSRELHADRFEVHCCKRTWDEQRPLCRECGRTTLFGQARLDFVQVMLLNQLRRRNCNPLRTVDGRAGASERKLEVINSQIIAIVLRPVNHVARIFECRLHEMREGVFLSSSEMNDAANHAVARSAAISIAKQLDELPKGDAKELCIDASKVSFESMQYVIGNQRPFLPCGDLAVTPDLISRPS